MYAPFKFIVTMTSKSLGRNMLWDQGANRKAEAVRSQNRFTVQRRNGNNDPILQGQVRCTALYCPQQYCVALYWSVPHCTALTVPSHPLPYRIELYWTAAMYGTLPHCTVLSCTVLYCTVLCCTVLYCTVFWWWCWYWPLWHHLHLFRCRCTVKFAYVSVINILGGMVGQCILGDKRAVKKAKHDTSRYNCPLFHDNYPNCAPQVPKPNMHKKRVYLATFICKICQKLTQQVSGSGQFSTTLFQSPSG